LPALLTFISRDGRAPILIRPGRTTLGRSSDCDLRFDDPLLSRVHCRLDCLSRELRVKDLGSANGTLVNGARVLEASLKTGDILELGGLRLHVEVCDEAALDKAVRVGRAGPYELIELLAEGRSGKVYRARDSRTGERAAVKILHRELCSDAQAVARFRRESELLRGLRHPNIVSLLESGSHEGVLYAAMEFVEGETLSALLRRETRLSVPQSLHAACRVADALECARVLEIVHRDVKPANILLAADGAVKLADFGLAKQACAAASPVTRAGQGMGTPHYMPPEQVLDAQGADHRSDLYALAATLYHMLSGEPPFFGGGVREVLPRIMKEAPAPLLSRRPDCPAKVEDIVLKALAKDPRERPATAGEFAAALEKAIRELGPGVAFLH
jgi:serine/threonine-protein kinase